MLAISDGSLADPSKEILKEFGRRVDMPGFLFASTMERIRSSEDFLALVRALDKLSPKDRDSFVDAAEIVFEGLSVFANSGWSRDQLGDREMSEAQRCYEEIDSIARSWNRPDLMAELACAAQPDALRTYSRTFLAADASLDRLVDGLRHDNPYVRELAIQLLARRNVASDAVVDGLARALREDHPKTIQCHEDDDLAHQGFEIGLDLDRRLHHRAALALFQIAADDPRSVPAHEFLLGRPGPEIRRRAAMALGRIGAPAAAAIETLVEGLDADGLEVQREIATALGMIGTMTEAVRTALERAAASNDQNLRRRAAAALRSLAGR